MSDTDGDGLSDYEEIGLGFEDLATLNSHRTVLVALNGAQATNTFGYWAIQGASIYARERSGYRRIRASGRHWRNVRSGSGGNAAQSVDLARLL